MNRLPPNLRLFTNSFHKTFSSCALTDSLIVIPVEKEIPMKSTVNNGELQNDKQ